MSRIKTRLSYAVSGPFNIQDPIAEIASQGETDRFQYLLAYADDGVIWGVWKDQKWLLSSDPEAYPEISPRLRPETLWEVRLFGKQSEWMLWKTETGFQARAILDGHGDPGMAFDEAYILWGTDQVDRREPFTQVREADLGIRHTPPLSWKGRHKLNLQVRHYIAYDGQGAAYVRLSRLVDLNNSGGIQ